MKFLSEHADTIAQAVNLFDELGNTQHQTAFQGNAYLDQNVFNAPRNQQIFQKIAAQDEPLTHVDIRQMNQIAANLAGNIKSPQDAEAYKTFQGAAMAAIVGNHLIHAPSDGKTATYRNVKFEADHAPHVIYTDMQHLRDKDQLMPLHELKNIPKVSNPDITAGFEEATPARDSASANEFKFNRPRNISQPRRGDLVALKTAPLNPVTPDSMRLIEGEHPFGPRADETKYPPVKLARMDAKTAYATYYEGQGQSYEVSFGSLNFRQGTFVQGSSFTLTVHQMMKEAQREGNIITKNIDLPNQLFNFSNKKTDEAWVYGNISVHAKGELLVDAKGRWEFHGKLSPELAKDDTTGEIYRGDRFNFNPQPWKRRGYFTEFGVRIFHDTPGTSFKIHFINEGVNVDLSNKK